MRFEWVDNGRVHVARVGEWRIEALSQANGSAYVKVSLDGAVLLDGRLEAWTLDEAKAAAERWVREYVAPFVEAEREACAEIAMRHTIAPGCAMTEPGLSGAQVRLARAAVAQATSIAQAIRARRDGAK